MKMLATCASGEHWIKRSGWAGSLRHDLGKDTSLSTQTYKWVLANLGLTLNWMEYIYSKSLHMHDTEAKVSSGCMGHT